MDTEVIGTFLGVFLMFCLFSFLYRDNPFYKFAEHLFIGISIGYYVSTQFWEVLWVKLVETLVSNPDPVMAWGFYIIPAVLCAMMLARYIKPIAWLGRIPIAFVIGANVGTSGAAWARGVLVPQTRATIKPVVHTAETREAAELCLAALEDPSWFARFTCEYGELINNGLIFVGVCSALLYFFFSRPHTGALGVVSRVGILFLMLAFGASFGFTVMGRIALAVGRAQFALEAPVASVMSIVIIVVGLAVWSRYIAEPPEDSSEA